MKKTTEGAFFGYCWGDRNLRVNFHQICRQWCTVPILLQGHSTHIGLPKTDVKHSDVRYQPMYMLARVQNTKSRLLEEKRAIFANGEDMTCQNWPTRLAKCRNGVDGGDTLHWEWKGVDE